MITAKQAAARRKNGKLSRGPVTAEGKARSAGHALKFGFFAQNPVLPGEEAAFDAYRQQMLESFAPAGPMQKMLVDQIVSASWQLRRMAVIEASVIGSNMYVCEDDDADVDPAGPQLVLGRAFIRDVEGANVIAKMSRSEVRLDRLLHRSLAELWRQKVKFQIEPTEGLNAFTRAA